MIEQGFFPEGLVESTAHTALSGIPTSSTHEKCTHHSRLLLLSLDDIYWQGNAYPSGTACRGDRRRTSYGQARGGGPLKPEPSSGRSNAGPPLRTLATRSGEVMTALWAAHRSISKHKINSRFYRDMMLCFGCHTNFIFLSVIHAGTVGFNGQAGLSLGRWLGAGRCHDRCRCQGDRLSRGISFR